MRKSEFRYNTNPAVKNPKGEGHVAYVTVKHKKHSKINTITHARTFYGEPTVKMNVNPNRTSKDKRPSRFSVPVWENNSYLKDKPNKGYWKIDERDKKAIKKFNKQYAKKQRKK
ncbi:MAG: hypothetical protein IJZ93_01120 [Clostridia bacterium]|nr:hypothetical protein [Clostridia bacterium]